MQINSLATSIKRASWLVLATLSAMGFSSLVLPQASSAQSCSDAQALQGCPSPNERDAFSGEGGGDLSVFDLMHRAQMGSLQNADEFTAEQRANINSAADVFRAQQMQRMKQGQQEVAPVEPAIAPSEQN